MTVIQRGRFTGLNSWAPAASAILRKKKSQQNDLETKFCTWRRHEDTKGRERESSGDRGLCFCLQRCDIICLQLPLSLHSPHLCPSFLSNPTVRHPCLPFRVFAPEPRKGIYRFTALRRRDGGGAGGSPCSGGQLQTQAAHCYTAAFSVLTSCHVSLYRHVCRGVCTRV